MFERLSSEPIYNTRAVVQRTGVPADTFRAWERRYQIPAPSRDSSNRRLYSELDVSVIGWLRDQTRTGVTVSQAVALFHSQNGRRLRNRSTESTTEPELQMPGLVANSPFSELRRQLVESLNALDGATARAIVQESLSICNVESVCQDLLYGAYVEITSESRRTLGACSCEQFACSFVQRKLSALFNQSNPDEGRGPIVAACPEGEYHEIDLLLTSLYLSRHGYKIVYLGANVPDAQLVHSVMSTNPGLVVLMGKSSTSVERIGNSIHSLRLNLPTPPQIAFGGHIFVSCPRLLESIDARFVGRDAREAVLTVDLIFAQLAS